MDLAYHTLDRLDNLLERIHAAALNEPSETLQRICADATVDMKTSLGELRERLTEVERQSEKLAKAQADAIVNSAMITTELHEAKEALEVEISKRRQTEEELRRLAMIAEQAGEGIAVANLDGILQFVNDAWCSMHGYESRAELVGKHLSVFHTDEQMRTDVIPFCERLKYDKHAFSEVGHIRRDGTSFPTEMIGTVLNDDEGKPVGLICFATDITERKRTESEAARSAATRDALNLILSEALACDTEEDLGKTCLAAAEELTGSQFGFLGFLNSEGLFDTAAISNPGWDVCELAKGEVAVAVRGMPIRGIDRMTIRVGESRIVNDLTSHPDRVGLPEGHAPVHCFLGVPLKENRKTIGMIGLGNKCGGYAVADQEAIETLSGAIVAAFRRKRAEETLRLQSTALNSAANAIVITNRDGAIEWVNPACTRLTGYALEEVQGQNLRALMSGAQDEASYRQMWETITSGTVWHGELVNRHKNGSLYTEETIITPVVNENDDITHFIAIKQDVTKRNQAEQRLREVNEFQRQVLDTAATAVFTVDTARRITSVNAEFCRILGYEKEEVVGQHCDLLQGEPHQHRCRLYNHGRCAPIFRKQCTLRAKDGRVLTVIKNAELVKDEAGRVTGGIESFVDVTELIEAREQAEAASRAKSEFLANMSHELRTPLNGVIGMTELLLASDLDERHMHFASLARLSGETLLALINDVLDFSKIEAGKLELEEIDFDLRESVESVVASFAHRAEEKGLELICGVAPNVPSAVCGDAGRLQQILLNLTNNAIKFTESGEIAVRAALDSENDRNVCVRFEVVDTGIGIPPDRQDRLFASFSQVDASTTRKYGGTGLGLAICKNLVELMGGHIGVESEPACGAKFWFTVTFEKAPEDAKRASEQLPTELRGRRVLAVDDNATNREILLEELSGWGLVCHAASDGLEALAMLRKATAAETPYHLAVLDMRVPELDGAQLARVIKNDSELKSTELILLSSLGRGVEVEESQSMGFAAWLNKPIRSAQLLNTIKRVLGGCPSQEDTSVDSCPVLEKQASSATAENVRILLAEDNEISQEVAVELLKRAGYQCDVVASGRQAVEAALEKPYDLILMDCQMPEMDGFDATRAIRQHEQNGTLSREQNGRVPIVALTANAIKGDRERCLEAGMDDYATKPLDPDRLVQVIQTHLRANRGPQEDLSPPTADEPKAELELGGTAEAHPPTYRSTPFDVDTLLKRWGNDREFVARLITKFVARAPDDLERLQRAITAGDTEETTRLAHGLKGAAAYVAAEKVRKLAAKLETMGRNGDLGEAESLLTDLKQELARTQPVPCGSQR